MTILDDPSSFTSPFKWSLEGNGPRPPSLSGLLKPLVDAVENLMEVELLRTYHRQPSPKAFCTIPQLNVTTQSKNPED
ncbi:hypothetical protein CEXT_584571 [Caerostris extrusa]|uniref:Uncharacterized protein n=1 Tax=Caerostris extrusa TaxID=172846 RepID=A0AAV4U725_CAEEX|nr:hypothetical protein CEXT_584571 [Caerostris extrusa]